MSPRPRGARFGSARILGCCTWKSCRKCLERESAALSPPRHGQPRCSCATERWSRSRKARLPDPRIIVEIREPVIATTISSQNKSDRCQDLNAKRGTQTNCTIGAARRSVHDCR